MGSVDFKRVHTKVREGESGVRLWLYERQRYLIKPKRSENILTLVFDTRRKQIEENELYEQTLCKYNVYGYQVKITTQRKIGCQTVKYATTQKRQNPDNLYVDDTCKYGFRNTPDKSK